MENENDNENWLIDIKLPFPEEDLKIIDKDKDDYSDDSDIAKKRLSSTLKKIIEIIPISKDSDTFDELKRCFNDLKYKAPEMQHSIWNWIIETICEESPIKPFYKFDFDKLSENDKNWIYIWKCIDIAKQNEWR